jgi:hypothetical protein
MKACFKAPASPVRIRFSIAVGAAPTPGKIIRWAFFKSAGLAVMTDSIPVSAQALCTLPIFPAP